MRSARPHLETHSRGRGHSAVAGVAYRLGVAVYDERTGTLHDYSRKAGVMAWRHVLPPGAPEWAADVAECWNRAERAERRKDAQVARDYRLPIPLTFSGSSAEELAWRIAEQLATELGTAVTVALHRDNARDSFGREKAPEAVGFHAHLYLPTRALALDGFGAKFAELANRSTSGAIVERWNRLWSEEANRLAARDGLRVRTDWRSLARLGLSEDPQPTLGVAACAMERRGLRSRKGDELIEHQTPAAMSHPAALAERIRERRHAAQITSADEGDPLMLPLLANLRARAMRREEPTTETEEGSERGETGAGEIHEPVPRSALRFIPTVCPTTVQSEVWRRWDARVKAEQEWLRKHEGEERRRNAALEKAEMALAVARANRDEWLKRHPRPWSWWIFGAAAVTAWKEARAAQQEQVTGAKIRHKEAEALTGVDAERVLCRERRDHEETLAYVTEQRSKAEWIPPNTAKPLPVLDTAPALPISAPTRRGPRM